MTSDRYDAYRLVLAAAEPGGHHELADVAEALLLTRGAPSTATEALLRTGALEISGMVGSGELKDADAEILWSVLKLCGPDSPEGARPRERRPAPQTSRR